MNCIAEFGDQKHSSQSCDANCQPRMMYAAHFSFFKENISDLHCAKIVIMCCRSCGVRLFAILSNIVIAVMQTYLLIFIMHC